MTDGNRTKPLYHERKMTLIMRLTTFLDLEITDVREGAFRNTTYISSTIRYSDPERYNIVFLGTF